MLFFVGAHGEIASQERRNFVGCFFPVAEAHHIERSATSVVIQQVACIRERNDDIIFVKIFLYRKHGGGTQRKLFIRRLQAAGRKMPNVEKLERKKEIFGVDGEGVLYAAPHNGIASAVGFEAGVSL